MRGSVRTCLSGIAAALIAAPSCAQGLQRIDMGQLPIADFNLAGGSFVATLYENEVPFSSKVLIECQDCAQTTDAVVGVEEAAPGADTHFMSNPLSYLSKLNSDCHAQAEACKVTQASAGGLKGYAYVARYSDGFYVVEQTYFSNGLRFVVVATGPSLEVNQANVATLLKVAGPMVTGQKP